ncbi:MAG: Hpt domain-containing protein [Desulfobacterales bacterium]|nr:Hpt domain-containing protein [Desulfobacterales bacterium]
MDSNSFPIDIEHELKEFGNNVEFFNDLLNDFFKQVEKRISIMEKAALDKDAHTLKVQAHAIKGGAVNLSANILSEAAYNIEDICKKGDLDKSVEKIEKIRNEFSILKEYVRNHSSLKL